MRVPLGAWIEGIRKELEAGIASFDERRRSDPDALGLTCTDIELEAEVLSESQEQLGGEVKFWIASASVDSTGTTTTRQKLVLRLRPERELTLGSEGADLID